MGRGDFNLPFHTNQRTFRYYPGWKIPDNLTELPYIQKAPASGSVFRQQGFFSSLLRIEFMKRILCHLDGNLPGFCDTRLLHHGFFNDFQPFLAGSVHFLQMGETPFRRQ